MKEIIQYFLVWALIVFEPLAFIWSLNTLFNAAIDYGFFEWLAALVLSLFARVWCRGSEAFKS